MSDERDRRLAFNEALIREVNEVVEGLSEGWFEPGEPIEFRCECADPGCEQRIFLTRDDYLRVRSSPTWFAIVPGHEAPDIERVVGTVGDAHIVEKLGVGREIAEQTDRRT
jgi:hypothetical protein